MDANFPLTLQPRRLALVHSCWLRLKWTIGIVVCRYPIELREDVRPPLPSSALLARHSPPQSATAR